MSSRRFIYTRSGLFALPPLAESNKGLDEISKRCVKSCLSIGVWMHVFKSCHQTATSVILLIGWGNQLRRKKTTKYFTICTKNTKLYIYLLELYSHSSKFVHHWDRFGDVKHYIAAKLQSSLIIKSRKPRNIFLQTLTGHHESIFTNIWELEYSLMIIIIIQQYYLYSHITSYCWNLIISLFLFQKANLYQIIQITSGCQSLDI